MKKGIAGLSAAETGELSKLQTYVFMLGVKGTPQEKGENWWEKDGTVNGTTSLSKP